MSKKIFILDTSVFLSDPNSIYSFNNNDIVVPFKVLEELDKQKSRADLVGSNARLMIKLFDKLREKGNLSKGVRIEKRKGFIFVKSHQQQENSSIDLSIADNIIIAVAMEEKKLNPGKKIIIVTKDINLRVKCDAMQLEAEDFNENQIIEKREYLYSGYKEYLVDEQTIDQLYEGKQIFLEKKEKIIFHPNQFVMLISNSNDKKTALVRFIDYSKPLKKIKTGQKMFGVTARNKEQSFALDLLTDLDVPVVSLTGNAGSGKTMLALAAGLQQVLEEKKYKRLIVSRPIQPMGKELGFLPGSLEEKMIPWLKPISDNLQTLLNNDKIMLEEYVEDGIIELEALQYIRGRSISNSYIIVDEAQNLSLHEIKTIVTRVGEGTKIVFTGDTSQIDTIYLNEFSCGLTILIEKLKDQEISGHITLIKGERSKVATITSKILET